MTRFQISPSKLLVARCGRALDLLNKHTPPDTPEFENTLLGSEIHDVLHEINCYDGVIDDIALDVIMTKSCSHAFEVQRRYALKYLDNFPYHMVTLSEFACGLDENLKEAPFETALFRGRIDALLMETETRMVIVDHKSAWNVYSPDSDQLRFYAWMLSKIFPHIQEFVLSIYFLRYGQWIRTDFAMGRKSLANVERATIIAAENAWATQLGVPTPGKYCTFCKYAMSCPAAIKSVNVVSSPQDATDMARTLHVMKKQVLEMSGLLQNYAKENGFIPIDGEYGYGYGEKEAQVANVDDVLKVIADNPQAKKALKVDMKMVKRLKLDIPVTTKYSSRWGAFTQGTPMEEDDVT